MEGSLGSVACFGKESCVRLFILAFKDLYRKLDISLGSLFHYNPSAGVHGVGDVEGRVKRQTHRGRVLRWRY